MGSKNKNKNKKDEKLQLGASLKDGRDYKIRDSVVFNVLYVKKMTYMGI